MMAVLAGRTSGGGARGGGMANLQKLDLAHGAGILIGSAGLKPLSTMARRNSLLSAIMIVGGRTTAGDGLRYGLILAFGMSSFSYFFSEKIALMSPRAQPVSQTHPRAAR